MRAPNAAPVDRRLLTSEHAPSRSPLLWPQGQRPADLGREMSHGKYAHITAELLARKGEARPWPALTAAEEMPEHRPWRPARRRAAAPAAGNQGEKLRHPHVGA